MIIRIKRQFLTLCYVFLTVFFSQPKLAKADACLYKNNSQQIAQFFDQDSNWLEVASPNSFHIAENKPLKLEIHFDNFRSSKVFIDGKTLGKITKLCFKSPIHLIVTSKWNGVNINFTLQKIAKDLIESKFSYLTYTEVYYYRPEAQVIAN